MSGSEFNGKLNMDSVSIGQSLLMEQQAEFDEVVLRGANVGGQISMSGSEFRGKLNMGAVSIGQSLLMGKQAEFDEVVLVGATVGGQISTSGSKFNGKLNMDSVSIKRDLFMHEQAEFGEVVLVGARVGDQISMSGSKFNGKLNMGAVSIGQSLLMGKQAEFDEVVLVGANVGGQISMSGSKFNGKLNMDSVSIKRDLFMHEQAEFGEVVLVGAKVGDQISMSGSKFNGKLNMGAVSIGQSLLMGKQAEFDEVVLVGANVGGQISMIGSKFNGKLNMDSASIGQSLFMRTAELKVPAHLVFITVGSNLDARRATLSGMDLSGAQVKGELRLVDTRWKCYAKENRKLINPKLTLRNTSVGALQDSKETWPSCLQREFQGFTYERLGGLQTTDDTNHYSRGIRWFREWLARDTPYSPQPYRHLAATLRAAGHEGMADAILVANRDRERRSAKWWQPKKWALWLFKIVIGYGYGWRNFLALVWASALVALGTVVLHLSGEQSFDVDGWSRKIIYSVDMLVPAIHLREEHYSVEMDLTTGAQYYFYVHKIMGYVLIFFVIAGLSGITDRQGRR